MIQQGSGSPTDALASAVSDSGIPFGLGALALVMLGYLFRSYWKQSGYWEQLTASARTAESLARGDAAAARADASAAWAEAHSARIAADRAQQAFEHCEEEHERTKKRLHQLEERLRELGFDV